MFFCIYEKRVFFNPVKRYHLVCIILNSFDTDAKKVVFGKALSMSWKIFASETNLVMGEDKYCTIFQLMFTCKCLSHNTSSFFF